MKIQHNKAELYTMSIPNVTSCQATISYQISTHWSRQYAIKRYQHYVKLC